MAENLYVLGHPVAHSKSPAMHNAAYRALGLRWEYGFADRPTELSARVFLNARGWRGCNVTMPWKPLAYEVADVRSAAAKAAFGANVLVNWAGRVHADNTDGKGCVSFLRRVGVDFGGARVAVCGTGPTSLSIAHACASEGAACVTVLGRSLERAEAVVGEYRLRVGAEPDTSPVRALSYDRAGEAAVADAAVVIDATPLGMKPGDPPPFDTAALSAGQTVLDVVYGHGETALLAAAREAGCAAHDGAGMLVAQAVETVYDLAEVTECFSIPSHVDLFAIMADAAGFDLPAAVQSGQST